VLSRRHFLHLGAAAAVVASTRARADKGTMNTRAIPKTGEQMPCVGLGTWQTFDVGASRKEREPIEEVLKAFLDTGARLIDSSPMYGRAEEVTGDALAAIGAGGPAPTASMTRGGPPAKPFLATKVWTTGKQAGIDEMTRSMKRMRTGRMDLMQIHNLLDWKTHLPVLREWKAAGKIRYLGVTHYQHGQFDEIEKLVRDDKLDFIQIPYSIVDRAAERRLLPAAADNATAVLVMTPFESGALFRQVAGKPLPAVAAEIDCTSWAQFFLKFILGHPAITCPIPATSNPKHVADNLRAGFGRVPDAKQRDQMRTAIGA
jgi:diketogulonate reductase-like aldo/keto reductase